MPSITRGTGVLLQPGTSSALGERTVSVGRQRQRAATVLRTLESTSSLHGSVLRDLDARQHALSITNTRTLEGPALGSTSPYCYNAHSHPRSFPPVLLPNTLPSLGLLVYSSHSLQKTWEPLPSSSFSFGSMDLGRIAESLERFFKAPPVGGGGLPDVVLSGVGTRRRCLQAPPGSLDLQAGWEPVF